MIPLDVIWTAVGGLDCRLCAAVLQLQFAKRSIQQHSALFAAHGCSNSLTCAAMLLLQELAPRHAQIHATLNLFPALTALDLSGALHGLVLLDFDAKWCPCYMLPDTTPTAAHVTASATAAAAAAAAALLCCELPAHGTASRHWALNAVALNANSITVQHDVTLLLLPELPFAGLHISCSSSLLMCSHQWLCAQAARM